MLADFAKLAQFPHVARAKRKNEIKDFECVTDLVDADLTLEVDFLPYSEQACHNLSKPLQLLLLSSRVCFFNDLHNLCPPSPCLANMAKLGEHGQAWRPWPSLANMAKLGEHGQAWRTWPSLANMAKLGDHGQAWRAWPSLANMAKLGEHGQAWRPWPSLATMAKLGDHGQAWRPWPSLASMAKLGDHGQAWRAWPSLASMAMTSLAMAIAPFQPEGAVKATKGLTLNRQENFGSYNSAECDLMYKKFSADEVRGHQSVSEPIHVTRYFFCLLSKGGWDDVAQRVEG
uniref:SFRICE_021126 n=1 Tax=Spodoptera frugiperda TaxID=7108 RepID=A0A2H1VIP7_SPOFR